MCRPPVQLYRGRALRSALATLREQGESAPESLDHLANQLAWHGIEAEVRVGSCQAGPPAVQLPRMAADLHADLLVVGGFGHRPLREVVFGGVTLALIRHGELPIFMPH